MSVEGVDGVSFYIFAQKTRCLYRGTIHPDCIALSLPSDIGYTDFVRFLKAFSLHTRNL